MNRRSVEDVPATAHFSFLYGAFRLSDWEVPYFASTVTLEEAARDLRLTTDIPGAEEITWRLEELYQRDVDWPRVSSQILPYLRNRAEPQFFNSIIIALLPFDQRAGALLDRFDDASEWSPPPLADADRFVKQLDIGPIRLGFWEDWQAPQDPGFRTGELRWNTKEVFGVAIDGQHRLAAIKQYVEGASGTAASDTLIPVLFLLFDPRAGFSGQDQRPVLDLLRALFIDLNKHAQTVSRTREILLDDRDAHAVCVRKLVGPELSAHTDELAGFPPRLPLSLVDWHREQAKFDDGPYLTTVLGLDWIISRVLNTKPIGEFTDYSAVRNQIGRLERQLGIELSGATARVEELENIKLSPFSYTDSELSDIANAFGEVWSRPLCGALTRFNPYARFLDMRLRNKTLGLEFQHWYRLYERKQKERIAGRATTEYGQFLTRLSNRRDDPIGEGTLEAQLDALEAAKSGNLAFNVVFQRTLIDALMEYAKIDHGAVSELEYFWEEEEEYPDFGDEVDDEVEEGALDEEAPEVADVGTGEGGDEATFKARVIRRGDEFISAMNRLEDAWPELLEVNATFESGDEAPRIFWLGTLRKAEGGIDFTQGASNRAKDLLFMAAAMVLYDDLTEPDESSDFEEFWGLCLDGSGPSICNRVGRAIKRFSNREVSAAGRILKARDEEFDEDVAQEECYWRLRFLWEQLGL